MKRIYFTLLAFLPLFSIAQERIMVIADPHVIPQSLVEPGEAMDNMMSSQRKMLDLSESSWYALMDTAMKYKPALVLIPGDLTKDSEKASHELVCQSLRQLREAGIQTLVIPGNHDIGGKAYAYKGSDRIEVENLKDEEWETQYEWLYAEATAKDPGSHSYTAEPLPGVTVLGIDGSHNSAGTGSLSEESLGWILAQADEANAKGNLLIAMCHWQILEHFDMQGTLESACRLMDADLIRDSLMHHGVRFLLTGHFHVNSISAYRDTTGLTTDSLIEVSTGSPITYPCPYRWLTLSEDRSRIEVETEDLSSLPGQPDLPGYSREWMRLHTQNWVPQLALRAWNKAENSMDKIEEKFGGMIPIDKLKTVIPTTDSAKIALAEKYFSSTAAELYLLHSEANEPEHPQADSLAQEVYKGMEGMIDEILSVNPLLQISMGTMLCAIATEVAHIPVQSLVEDVTLWSTVHANRTDDLRAAFTVNESKGIEGLEPTADSIQPALKVLQNGTIYIQRGAKTYTLQGQESVKK